MDVALFAFRNPFSRGAILADEVGLGKTIEAGHLLAQKWAKRKRHLLVIVPANLRKQWSQELEDKFYLPSVILESRSFNNAIRAGHLNPFQQDAIVLCSYQFARAKEPYLSADPLGARGHRRGTPAPQCVQRIEQDRRRDQGGGRAVRTPSWSVREAVGAALTEAHGRRQGDFLEELTSRNGRWVDLETDKLDRWVEDRRASRKTELAELDEALREAKKAARLAPSPCGGECREGGELRSLVAAASSE